MRLCLPLSACTQAWSARCSTTRDAGFGSTRTHPHRRPARVLDAVRDRALGDVTPASPHWAAPARTFLDLQDLFDERPRGGLVARTLAKLPVVGVAGGWVDERGAIRKAAKQTQRLIA